MEMKFCRRCGEALEHVEKHIYRCANGHILFANQSPSTAVFLLTADNQTILFVRANEPHKGMLDAAGGFLEGEETFEDGAVRELHEETSLEPSDYEPLKFLASAAAPYPYKGEDIPVIAAMFWTRVKPNSIAKIKPGDDVNEMRIIPLHEIALDQLHNDDIRVGIHALRKMFPNNMNVRR